MPNCCSSSLNRLMRGKARETKKAQTLGAPPAPGPAFVLCPDFLSPNLRTRGTSQTTAVSVTHPSVGHLRLPGARFCAKHIVLQHLLEPSR